MKIKPLDTPEVSQVRTATSVAPQETKPNQNAAATDDAAKLSLRLVAQTESSSSSDKVAQIKAQVDSGTYSVDSKDIATKLAVDLL